MRQQRMKINDRECFYHLFNRLVVYRGQYPLTSSDKEFGFNLVRKLMNYYLIDVISMAWMGHHYHLVVHVSPDLPSLETIAARHNRFYAQKSFHLDPEEDPELCLEVGRKMQDISHFMRVFQHSYACWFNQVHDHLGHVWGSRFKSTILEGREALWTCVKYVELNPVRANLTQDPAAYRHTTWGWYSGSGKHPFEENFVFYMRRSLGERAKNWHAARLFAEFRGELARTIAAESGKSSEDILRLREQARHGESMPLRFLRRTRHWTEGAILGSQDFVQKIGGRFDDPARVMKKRLSRSTDNGVTLYAFKRLKPTD